MFFEKTEMESHKGSLERQEASPSIDYTMCASRGATECHKNWLSLKTTVKSCFLSNNLDGYGVEDRQTQREREEEPDKKKRSTDLWWVLTQTQVTPHRCS